MIALNSPLKPNLKKLQKYLEQINEKGWFTNFGSLHDELTVRLEEYLGVHNLLLVSNGTLALQVAGKALESQSLLSTPFSFVATVSAFEWQNYDIAFADIDRNSYNLSPDAVNNAFEKGCLADTILATHVYGNPCDVASFEQINKQRNCKIIYDAAHAFGVKLGNKSVLNFGDASVLSFHATKVFHTVEGGAIVFKKAEDYQKAKNMINFGIKPGFGVVSSGINAKFNEYQAAVGLVNLDDMDNVLEHRSNLFNLYRNGLRDVVELPVWHSEASMNGAYMPIRLKDSNQLITVKAALLEKNIESRHYFKPSLETVYTDYHNYGSVNSSEVSKSVLCLPMHVHMQIEDIIRVVDTVKLGLK